MLRVRFHGRGGHGIKTASRILGTAAFLGGLYAQDALVYGAERRGAALAAFTRIDTEPILERGVITDPDLILVGDETLLADPAAGVLISHERASAVFVNSPRDALAVAAQHGIACPVLPLDLTSITTELLGRGFQMSSASPFGSRTATGVCGVPQHKKDLFALWLAHQPPYVATLSTADPVDLAEKVRRGSRLRGPKLFTALATCPPGWGYDPALGHQLARLAVETGVWPLKEAVHGQVRHTYIPDRRRPVEDYLRTQRRFQHLFAPVRQEEMIHKIQAGVDAYWQQVS